MMKKTYLIFKQKHFPGRQGKSKRYREALIVLFMLLCVLPANGRENEKHDVLFHWEFSIGGTAYYVSSANYWNFGPELTVQYAFSNTKGIYVSVIYPTVRMTSRGYGFREGFAFDLGGWLSPRVLQPWLKFGVGLSYIFGSDADGSQIRGTGAHIGTQASYWFKRNLGVWVRGILRLWIKEGSNNWKSSPSFSAGIGFRF